MIHIILFMFFMFKYADAGFGTDKIELNVMSFNVRWDGLDTGKNAWINRKPLVIEAIQKFAPDVVGLQEPSLSQTHDLEEGLENYTSFTGPNQRDEHIPILYRSNRFRLIDSGSFWLVENSDLSGGTRRCAWILLMEKETKRSFYVYNNHFDHRSPESRKQSALALIKGIRNRKYHIPFVVVGDFNEDESGLSINYLREFGDPNFGHEHSIVGNTGLVDTYREKYPAQLDVASGHGFTGKTKGERIDFIFVRKQDEVIDAQIIHYNKNGLYPSDHYPVTARVRLIY